MQRTVLYVKIERQQLSTLNSNEFVHVEISKHSLHFIICCWELFLSSRAHKKRETNGIFLRGEESNYWGNMTPWANRTL